MDDRTVSRKNVKKIKFTKSYKGLESVNSYDCQRPEGTREIKADEEEYCLTLIFFSLQLFLRQFHFVTLKLLSMRSTVRVSTQTNNHFPLSLSQKYICIHLRQRIFSRQVKREGQRKYALYICLHTTRRLPSILNVKSTKLCISTSYRFTLYFKWTNI